MKKLLLISPVLLIFACTTQQTLNEDSITASTSVIQPPLEGDFSNDTVFTIDPTIDNHVETPNGTSLDIPANCLVDKDGNLIKESVDIDFTQYHSAADIIGSGIPMTYDTLGEHYTFESAGMFTVRGFFNGEDAYVKDGKAIDVNLASDKNEKFNFYELDESTGDWSYEKNSTPEENPKFDPSVYPVQPEKVNEDAFVLDLNLDHSDFKELDHFSGIVWEYIGEDDSLDPRKNKWINSAGFDDFSLTPTERTFEYYLTMKNKKRSFTTKVRAALTGDDFDEAMSDFGDKRKELAQRMDRLQKPFIRSVSISGFGTYNYDYYHQMKEPEKILADFDFGKHNSEKENALVVVIYPEREVVVNYPMSQWNLFALDKTADPKLMAILPDNKVAVCQSNLSASYGKEKYTYSMQVLDKRLKDKSDLVDVISSL